MTVNHLHKINYWCTVSLSLPLRRIMVLIIASVFIFNPLCAQKEKGVIIKGNKNYENKKFDEAEKDYKKALQKNKNSYASQFNLGNAYYKQGKYEEATNQFEALTHKPAAEDSLAKVYHNLGNSLLKQRKFEESISAYKNALKNNPNDEETRYNMAYAQKMLKHQQQQQNNKNNKDNKDDKKDQKKGNKDKQDKKKDDKNKKNKDKQKQEQNQISKEDAQRLLDALQNDEKSIQDKVKKEGKRGVKVQIEKDW